MTELRWSDQAVADLQEIYDYLSAERPSALLAVMTAFRRLIVQLEEFPESAPLAIQKPDGRVYRAARAANYTVFYRVVNGTPFVARIWDSRRDPASLRLKD
jgi:plasmid stabilization system protein ParE